MRAASPTASLLLVCDPACLRLVLELEPGGEPVRGWLEDPDGRRERFERHDSTQPSAGPYAVFGPGHHR